MESAPKSHPRHEGIRSKVNGITSTCTRVCERENDCPFAGRSDGNKLKIEQMKRLMDASSSKPSMTQQFCPVTHLCNPSREGKDKGLNTRKTRRGHNQAQVEDRRQKTKQGEGDGRQPGHGFFSVQPLLGFHYPAAFQDFRRCVTLKQPSLPVLL